jgi:hypothetical protein
VVLLRAGGASRGGQGQEQREQAERGSGERGGTIRAGVQEGVHTSRNGKYARLPEQVRA